MKDTSFLILAGGKSHRMGTNKADLLYNGRTFLDTLVTKAQALGFEDILVSGYSGTSTGFNIVPDILKERGPLGGMHAAFRAAKFSSCFMVCVDMPLITDETITSLVMSHKSSHARATLLHHADRTEPLLAVYDTSTWEDIESVISQGSAPVFRALDKTGYQLFEFSGDESTLININTPDLYNFISGKSPQNPTALS